MTDGVMKPEGTARFLQAQVAGARLGLAVPEDVRRSFERVRELHLYGLFEYGFFTVVDQAAWVLPESALGMRFIEHYRGQVPFRHGEEAASLEASQFRDVAEAVGPGGRYSRREGWRLHGHEHYGEGRTFDASYSALMQWARREGLLRRWLDKRWSSNEDTIRYAVLTRVHPPDYAVPENWLEMGEEAREGWWTSFRRNTWERDEIELLVKLRNLVAHSAPGRVVMPVNSATSLIAAAAFINGLWSTSDPEPATN
jgi:hypothetical protein